MSIDKQEQSKDNTDEESPASTPDNEAGPSAPQETQPAKRKGGRKPVSYAPALARSPNAIPALFLGPHTEPAWT